MLLGLALGAGIVLLAAPDRSSRGRIAGRVKPARRQVRRRARQVRRSGRRTLDDTSRFRGAISDLGREFVHAARTELVTAAASRLPGAAGRTDVGHSIAVLRSAPDRLRAIRERLNPRSDA
ncbi:MAG: hypothetical protein EA422_06600 [Gemmatimonadales bacterium]|nr:MAG: hypothetical protein EA422_06600 [Gemmatimonadales bacterium]